MKIKEMARAGLMVAALALSALVIIGGLMYGMRWFSQEVTPINTVKMNGGVTCYQIITGDGAAISCIQLNKRNGLK